MRKRKMFISSTQLDRQDEYFTLEDLLILKKSYDDSYTPINTNHNYLSYPNGRIVDTILEEKNGVHIVYGIAEFWDKKENFKKISRRKEFKIGKIDNTLEIECSKSFEVGHNKLLLDKMVNDLKVYNPKVEYYFQKQVDPNTVLWIGSAIIGGILGSFGKDIYNATKTSLIGLIDKLKYNPGSNNDFLIFKQNYVHDNILRKIHLVVHRPNASDIENVYQKSIVQFDRLIKSQLKKYPNIAWLVLKWEKGNIKKHYHLDFHCIPSKWDVIPDEVIEKGNTSIEGTATLVKK